MHFEFGILPESLFSAEDVGSLIMSHSLQLLEHREILSVTEFTESKGATGAPKYFNAKRMVLLGLPTLSGHSQCLGWELFTSPAIASFMLKLPTKQSSSPWLTLTLKYILVRVRYSEIENPTSYLEHRNQESLPTVIIPEAIWLATMQQKLFCSINPNNSTLPHISFLG